MKRRAWLLLLAAVAFAAPAYAQTQTLFGFTGFDYVQSAAPGGLKVNRAAVPNFLAVTDNYHAVGFITSFSPIVVGPDMVANEYTFHLYDATVATSTLVGDFLEVSFQDNARVRAFEDSRSTGTAAVYGINPPNATSPSTFEDGSLILGADVDQLVLIYDYSTSQGNFLGNANLDEGSLLGQIPPGLQAGWIMSGLAGRPNATVPDGYVNQLSGELVIPTATNSRHGSWGSLKRLYR